VSLGACKFSALGAAVVCSYRPHIKLPAKFCIQIIMLEHWEVTWREYDQDYQNIVTVAILTTQPLPEPE